MTSVPASEMQKNFGKWHDRAFEGPVEITRYGRTTAVLVSASLFQEMWASFRKALPASALSHSDMRMISASTVETDRPFNLADIPEISAGDQLTDKN